MTSGHSTIDFTAACSGRGYRLRVWVPPMPAPAGGFPVLWVLDGEAYAGLAVSMVLARGMVGAEIAPAVVVGIGYPADDPATWMTRRYLDFTATPTGGERFARGAPTGGIEGFLDMIEHEAVARVAAQAPIDRARMAIAGHSLGGHAVLHALFTRPGLFERHVAISPSIWWHGCELLQHEAGFAARAAREGIATHVFIGVGALEQTPYAPRPGLEPMDLSNANEMIAHARVIERAQALAARLSALPQADVRCVCLDGETHASVPFAAWRQAMDLALPFRGFA